MTKNDQMDKFKFIHVIIKCTIESTEKLLKPWIYLIYLYLYIYKRILNIFKIQIRVYYKQEN